VSHVALQKTRAGEPMFRDVEALRIACGMLGLDVKQTNKYRWWGRHVGDYPLPEGMKAADLGSNALFVLSVSEEKKKELGLHDPYEIAIVEDPNNPGCYVPLYDFYGGGLGLDRVVGRPVYEGSRDKQPSLLAPKLKNHYDMACDALAAKEAGDTIEFLTRKQAHEKYPQLFPEPTQAEDEWVSIVETNPARVTA
jgi:hypothetical protein